MTSNQASMMSIVPVAAASAPTQAIARRCAAIAVPQKHAASPTSKPDQARSQCAEWCVRGSEDDSHNAHGSRPTPTAP
jgi:hypothetical protein